MFIHFFLYFCINMTQNIIRFSYKSWKYRQREPNQTNETKYFLCHLFIQENDPILHIWVAKVCESLGLAVNLKVKLESMCFQTVQWLSNISIWPALFKEQGSIKIWSCLWIMSRTKEITEDLGKRVDVAHHNINSTNPQSDRLCTNGGNSRPLLPSREVVDQRKWQKITPKQNV